MMGLLKVNEKNTASACTWSAGYNVNVACSCPCSCNLYFWAVLPTTLHLSPTIPSHSGLVLNSLSSLQVVAAAKKVSKIPVKHKKEAFQASSGKAWGNFRPGFSVSTSFGCHGKVEVTLLRWQVGRSTLAKAYGSNTSDVNGCKAASTMPMSLDERAQKS